MALLSDAYPGSKHVKDFGLQEADDDAIWACARSNDFAIVSKDDDFRQRSFLLGHPPKVIWIRLGNVPTTRILLRLIEARQPVSTFLADEASSFLTIE